MTIIYSGGIERKEKYSLNEIKVGVGKSCINVPDELFPFPIYEDFCFETMGDSGDLYARALVIDNGETKFLFVSTDVSDAPGLEMRIKVEEKFHISEDHMYLTASHNHSAPHGGGRKGNGLSRNPEKEVKETKYREVYETGIIKAIESAISTLRPAKYGFGEGKSFVNTHRDLLMEDGFWTQGQNYEGPSDKTLAVLKFSDYEGRLIGAVVNYACHGTCAFCSKDIDGKIKVTPGFAGIASSYVEARYDDEPVILWTNGASGDQNPLFSSEGFPRVYDKDGYTESIQTPLGTQYIIQRHIGYTHAVDIIKTLNIIESDKKNMRITTSATEVELDAQRRPDGADMGLNKLFIDNAVRIFRPELCVDGKPPEKKLVEMIPDGKISMKMWLAVLGDMGWIGIAGEPYSTIAMKCKAASPFRKTVMMLHVDDTIGAGYILDDASADHKVFQAYSRVRPGDVDTPIVNGVLELFDKALNN